MSRLDDPAYYGQPTVLSSSTVPDLTWRPCDHERAVDGECPDCGADVPEREASPDA